MKPDFSFTETVPMVEGAKEGKGGCALRFFKKIHFPRTRKDKSPQTTRRTARQMEPLGLLIDLMGDAETVVRNDAEHKSPLNIIIDRDKAGWWEFPNPSVCNHEYPIVAQRQQLIRDNK